MRDGVLRAGSRGLIGERGCMPTPARRPLGPVTVHSTNPLDLGMNHQVLAYGYELDGTALTLRVYDPNTDPASASK